MQSREIKATILVEPAAKARAKTFINPKTKRPVFYTPKKTRVTESDIKADIRHTLIELVAEMVCLLENPEVPIYLEATFFRMRPKHLPKRVTMPVSKPDLDNYAKLLKDALQKFIYANDSQITTMVVRKRFGLPPRIEVVVREDNIEPITNARNN